jgi:hypothetical protein
VQARFPFNESLVEVLAGADAIAKSEFLFVAVRGGQKLRPSTLQLKSGISESETTTMASPLMERGRTSASHHR